MRAKLWPVTRIMVLIGLALAGIFAACVPAEIPPARGTATPVSKKLEASGQKNEWEDVVAAARKEGTLLVYSALTPKVGDVIRSALKEKYNINVELVSGTGTELAVKIKSERNAGLYLADVGFLGPTTFVTALKPSGITEPLEPLLVLPEVKGPENWRGGKLPFLDKEEMAMVVVLTATPQYVRNTDLVKDGEIKTIFDLLDPKWKEKIVMGDPSIPGGASNWFAWTILEVLGKEKGPQFMKDLAAQKPLVTRDERLAVEWIARGKYPIGISPGVQSVSQFIHLGSPIEYMDIETTRKTSSGSGLINVFKNAPHPNAAKLFLNWVLSKEGSSVFAPASEFPSTRVDVPPEGILPILVPRPDDVNPDTKYENYNSVVGQMQKTAADIFGGLR